MRGLNTRVNEIAKSLVAPYATDPIMQRQVPKSLVDQYNQWIADRRRELEDVDAHEKCLRYLVNYRNTSDEFFRAGLTHTLVELKRDVTELGEN